MVKHTAVRLMRKNKGGEVEGKPNREIMYPSFTEPMVESTFLC